MDQWLSHFGAARILITLPSHQTSRSCERPAIAISYFREHGGFVLSAAIDKYVYITVHETFQPEYLIKYSMTEVVETIDQIKHPRE